jgi:hypothetical protein
MYFSKFIISGKNNSFFHKSQKIGEVFKATGSFLFVANFGAVDLENSH